MKRSDVIQALNAKIPADAVSSRDAGQGRTLSYLEGWYVIDRLNTIFGQGNWFYATDEMTPVYVGEVNGKYVAHYISKVVLSAYVPAEDGGKGTWVSFSDYGYGDGTDKMNPGKAHELAVKEAVTDGIKRCAKSLGMSMGLALYDKTKENVEDEAPKVQSKARAGDSSRAIAKSPKSVPDANAATERSAAQASTSAASTGTASATGQEIRELVISTARVAAAKKSTTAEALRSYVADTYKIPTSDKLRDQVEKLTVDQAKAFLDYLTPLAS